MSTGLKVLITGGSSGIGLELCRLFAADKHQLLIASKPQEELNKAQDLLKNEYPELSLDCFQVDLAEPAGSEKLYEFVKQQGMVPDIVINNAGFGTYGPLMSIDEQRELAMIQLNIVNVYKLTRLYLKDMVERDAGTIMNIASIAAFQPTPMMATYAATKAFVNSFSRALDFELEEAKSNVKVITVCPPSTRTPFQLSAGMQNTNTFDTFFTLDADRVARDAYRAIHGKSKVVLPGTNRKSLSWMVGLLPTKIQMKLARHYLSKRN